MCLAGQRTCRFQQIFIWVSAPPPHTQLLENIDLVPFFLICFKLEGSFCFVFATPTACGNSQAGDQTHTSSVPPARTVNEPNP